MHTALAWGNILHMPDLAEIRNYLPDDLIYRDKTTRKLSIKSRIILRNKTHNLSYYLLAKLLEKNNLPTTLLFSIKQTQSGRPYFSAQENMGLSLDFNISHSSEWVAIILHWRVVKKNNIIKIDDAIQRKDIVQKPDDLNKKANAVAIDIEAPQKVRNYQGLLNYYASEKEINWYNQQVSQDDAFYCTWCAREAVLKSQGVGIVKLHSVELSPEEKIINCIYSPSGSLYYSNELPFYLAYFIQENMQLESENNLGRQNKIDFYKWELKELQSATLNKQLRFNVNNK